MVLPVAIPYTNGTGRRKKTFHLVNIIGTFAKNGPTRLITNNNTPYNIDPIKAPIRNPVKNSNEFNFFIHA